VKPNQKLALALLPLAIGFFLLSRSGLSKYDGVFYGALVVFALSQLAILWFLFFRQKDD